MVQAITNTVDRRVAQVVQDRMSETPVLALQGPRSVGKSTLLRAIGDQYGREPVDLDDPGVRDVVDLAPDVFAGADRPVLVDEFQHVPVLLDAIKAELNRDSRPGQYVITGSTRYEALPRAAQSLTGRVHLIDVLPLSQGEIAGVRENFIETLLTDPDGVGPGHASTADRKEYAERIAAGGFPLALRQASQRARSRWFADYLDLVITRDVLELSQIRQRRQLPRLLRRLASQTSQVVNIGKAADATGMERSTAENYIRLMEAVFLMRQIPAWGTTLGSRVAQSPKISIVDSGLAAHLLRLAPDRLVAPSPSALTEFGHLLETFVAGEVIKQVSWLDQLVDVGHWRTHDGDEVDLVLEREDGSIVAIEVKASTRLHDVGKGFAALRRRTGGLFMAGVVFFLGGRGVRLSEDTIALPVDALWNRSG